MSGTFHYSSLSCLAVTGQVFRFLCFAVSEFVEGLASFIFLTVFQHFRLCTVSRVRFRTPSDTNAKKKKDMSHVVVHEKWIKVKPMKAMKTMKAMK